MHPYIYNISIGIYIRLTNVQGLHYCLGHLLVLSNENWICLMFMHVVFMFLKALVKSTNMIIKCVDGARNQIDGTFIIHGYGYKRGFFFLQY